MSIITLLWIWYYTFMGLFLVNLLICYCVSNLDNFERVVKAFWKVGGIILIVACVVLVGIVVRWWLKC